MSDLSSYDGDDTRPADRTLEVARAAYKSELNERQANGREHTSNESLDDKDPSKRTPPSASRPRNNRADNNAPAAAWKRSLPKSMAPSPLQTSPTGKERKGPEPINRSESLMSQDSGDPVDVAPLDKSGREGGMLELIAQSDNGAKDKPLSSVRPSSKRMSSTSSSAQLAPIVPPSANVDPLAAKTILGSIRRNINPAREANIISTLNIVDNQMAMAGIGIHSRASLFVSLLEESAQHSILNKADLANSWEALRAHLVESRSKVIRNDVMEDFMQCARSISAGNAESCARIAVEQLELMKPSTTARLGIPTFIAAVPDERLRADFHDLYEMSLAAMDADSDDENAYTVSFIEAAKLIDRRMNGRKTMGATVDRPKRGHRRNNSLGSVNSDRSKLSQSKSRGSIHSRAGSTSFQSQNGGKRTLKKQTTRVYDRLTGEEHIIEREAPPPSDRYADDNESVVSGRSGKSRYSRGTSAFENDKNSRNKCIVSVYNYPKDLSLAQLVELTTPPAGRAPVMIRHKDGLVKILYSNSMAANEVTDLLNNCTVNNVVLGATCEIRGQGGSDEALKSQSSAVYTRPLSMSSQKPLPSFAGRSPKTGDQNNGPPPPRSLPPQQPVFPEKEDATQLWDSETDLFVGTISLVLAAVCLGLGNGFESVSPLAYLHIFFLLLGFEFFNRGMGHAWHGFILSIGILVLSQSLGSLLGFAYFFSYPGRTAITVNVVLLFSVIFWLALAIVGVMLEYAYRYKFPDWTSVPFVFPAAHTMISTVMFGERFGVYFALGNAVTDFAPLQQVSAAFGIGGVNFIAVLIPTLVFLKVIRHEFKPPAARTVGFYVLALIVLITAMGFVEDGDYFYQRSVYRGGLHPTVPVSCITGRDYQFESDRWDEVMETTAARLAAGDAIVMWADRTMSVSTDNTEQELINRAVRMVNDTAGANRTYLGISYQRILGTRKVKDKFYLIGPGGKIVMHHDKTLPIPFLDDNVVESGDKDFVTYDTAALGKLGVGMGFEVSNPSYMRQSGFDKVDIVLQPLWSHGGLGRRRFEVDSIRAIENGFTLFRCDSNGVSGIVSPRGEVLNKQYVGLDPKHATVFNLPLRKRISTFYSAVGFSFDYICVAFTCLFWLLTITPWYFLDMIANAFTKKEEKKHHFIIARGTSGEDYDMTTAEDRRSVDDGNPFSAVSETALRVEDRSEDEEDEEDGRYSSYYNRVDYGGDAV